jgi:hypothetical protein
LHKRGILTLPKSNIKKVERGKIDNPNTQIHDLSLFWLGTGISMKSGVANTFLELEIKVVGVVCRNQNVSFAQKRYLMNNIVNLTWLILVGP